MPRHIDDKLFVRRKKKEEEEERKEKKKEKEQQEIDIHETGVQHGG